jgi:hypothetical protein
MGRTSPWTYTRWQTQAATGTQTWSLSTQQSHPRAASTHSAIVCTFHLSTTLSLLPSTSLRVTVMSHCLSSILSSPGLNNHMLLSSGEDGPPDMKTLSCVQQGGQTSQAVYELGKIPPMHGQPLGLFRWMSHIHHVLYHALIFLCIFDLTQLCTSAWCCLGKSLLHTDTSPALALCWKETLAT